MNNTKLFQTIQDKSLRKRPGFMSVVEFTIKDRSKANQRLFGYQIKQMEDTCIWFIKLL